MEYKTTATKSEAELEQGYSKIAESEDVIKFFATLLKIQDRIQKHGQIQN